MGELTGGFSTVGVEVQPENYEIKHYEIEVQRITEIYKSVSKNLPKEGSAHQFSEAENGEDSGEIEEVSPAKRLAAQRSQALGAAAKRLTRGVALRYLIDCKRKGFSMSIHLAKLLLSDLLGGQGGRSGVSESEIVRIAGSGPSGRKNRKLDISEKFTEIKASGIVEGHRRELAESKIQAAAIRQIAAIRARSK